ncbi:MAG: HD domain-containing protein [Candidatus Moraniibacteriota bacterium]
MSSEKVLGFEFEKAVRFLTEFVPISGENNKKPELFHSIRVGLYLYEKGYAKEIVLAGILHDIIEDSKVDVKMLEDEFGIEITRLVLACTKNKKIKDKKENIEDLIKRTVNNGQEALIVKAADTLDSFKWYTARKNNEQILYCLRNAEAILELKPGEFRDCIFDELKKWKDEYQYLLSK